MVRQELVSTADASDGSREGLSRRYRIELIDKVFGLLEAFDAEHRELTLRELVARTGQTQSGVFRIVTNLVDLGILERDGVTRRVRIGSKLYALGSLAVLDLRRLAMPHMQALRDRFGVTVNLSVREGQRVVLVEILETGRAFRMSSSVGSSEPLHATASGKCLLAFAADGEREQLVGSLPLVGYTPSTLAAPAALEAELAQVREQGFALDRGEYEPHGRCLAVPVFDRTGAVCGAMSVSGPPELLLPERMRPVLADLVEHGRHLSAELGSPTGTA